MKTTLAKELLSRENDSHHRKLAPATIAMFVHGILLFPSNLNRHPKQRYQGFGCLPRQKTALFNLQTHPGRILLHRLARHDDYPARDTSPILIASHQ